MLDDWLECEGHLYMVQQKSDMSQVKAVVEKDGKDYQVCTIRETESYVAINIEDFGAPDPDSSLAADYTSPAYLKTGGRNELIRCVQMDLADGCHGQVWMMYDLMEEVQEHDRFLLRCILLTLFVTVIASAATSLLMRRFVIRPVHSLAQSTKEFVPEEGGVYSRERVSKVNV